MKFCNLCETVMKKTTKTGKVMFVCICGNQIEGGDEDTLITSQVLEVTEMIYKHKNIIDNSPFDLAANKIARKCPKCGLDYMNLVRIGKMNTVLFTCECGFQTTTLE